MVAACRKLVARSEIYRTTFGMIKYWESRWRVPSSNFFMANQGEFSSLSADSFSPFDDSANSDSQGKMCALALPAPTRFWKSAKEKGMNWRPKISTNDEKGPIQLQAIRKRMALSIGQDITSFEFASWKVSDILLVDEKWRWRQWSTTGYECWNVQHVAVKID